MREMHNPDITVRTTAQLEAGGFVRSGVWRRDYASGSIRFEGENQLPREPGVYAYTVGGIVHYVGSAQRGLRKRLRHYEIANTLKTVHRIRQEILGLLVSGGEVEVFTIVPPPLTVNGLPVDVIAGLEEGCVFRWMPATDSDANQPVIPTQASRRFRGIAATPG